MSALKQNPFLVGFGAVMVLGVGALGYLTYSASQESADATAKYAEAEQELNRLTGLKPSPTEAVLKQLNEQKATVTAKRDALRKELAAIKVKDEAINGPTFQDRLKAAVAQLGAKAPDANVVLPGGKDKNPFYLGFNVYQAQPPKDAAAPHLLRQLRAIELVTNLFLDTKNVTLEEIARPELKEEKDPKPAAAADPKEKAGKGKEDDESKKVVQRSDVTLKFTTAQENLQKILNGIVANKQQLFVIRRVTIKNEKEDGPPRGNPAAPAFVPAPAEPPPPAETPAAPGAAPAPGTPPAPAAPAPGTPAPAAPGAAAPAAPAAAPVAAPEAAPAAPAVAGAAPNPADAPKGEKFEKIFGTELVKVTLELEIVEVADPEVAPEKPTAPKKEKQP